MILVDASNFSMKVLFSKNSCSIKVDPYHFKHLLLHELSNLAKKYKKYGKLVLVYDTPGYDKYWRKDIHPHYKGDRKAKREKTQTDWKNFFLCCNELREEINDNLTWHTIGVDRAEADDVIGVIAKYWHNFEKVHIISVDQDLLQLQQYSNVSQANPITGRLMKDSNPIVNLNEKIIRGDRGDYIPSILNPLDCFYKGVKQKPLATKKVTEWKFLPPEEFCDGPLMERYKLNKQLIDLDMIPEKYVKLIKTTFAQEWNYKKPNKSLKYLSANRY